MHSSSCGAHDCTAATSPRGACTIFRGRDGARRELGSAPHTLVPDRSPFGTKTSSGKTRKRREKRAAITSPTERVQGSGGRPDRATGPQTTPRSRESAKTGTRMPAREVKCPTGAASSATGHPPARSAVKRPHAAGAAATRSLPCARRSQAPGTRRMRTRWTVDCAAARRGPVAFGRRDPPIRLRPAGPRSPASAPRDTASSPSARSTPLPRWCTGPATPAPRHRDRARRHRPQALAGTLCHPALHPVFS
jgi:hypothetical protein